MSSSSGTLISKCTVFPDRKSEIRTLKLSASEIPMIMTEYIQKGVLLTSPNRPFDDLLTDLKRGLATTLCHFPPLAGRLATTPDGRIHMDCNDAGAELLAVSNKSLTIDDILCPGDVPDCVKDLFTYDKVINYQGHFRPLLAIQVTELADGIFMGFSMNHAAVDGVSLWHFINTLAEVTRGAPISNLPDFTRDTPLATQAVLRFPPGGPAVTSNSDAPLREKIFHFSRDAIARLKRRANEGCPNDAKDRLEISSFVSLCTQLWRSVTRARRETTLFRMAVNCRQRLNPKLDPHYFGNAVQSTTISASAEDLLTKDLGWGARLLRDTVATHDDSVVRRQVAEWTEHPRLFSLDSAEGASLAMGSSPRFPMYEGDFGWGRPLAVRSGPNMKFDGKMSAYPAREGGGNVDLEVILAPEAMARLEEDHEFMQYVSKAVTE